MLREWSGVRQVPGEGVRRWFTDEDMDLIVWYRQDGSVRGFQLCYGKRCTEHALTWTDDGSVSHAKVDDGETGRAGGPKQTPVLVQDGTIDAGRLIPEFLARAETIDAAVRDLIVDKLRRLEQCSGG